MEIQGLETRLRKQAEQAFAEELTRLLEPMRKLGSEIIAETQQRSADPLRILDAPKILKLYTLQESVSGSALAACADQPTRCSLEEVLGQIREAMYRDYMPMYCEIFIARWLEQVAQWQEMGSALFEDPEEQSAVPGDLGNLEA